MVSDAGSQLIKAGKVIDGGDPSKLDWNRIREGAAKSATEWKTIEPGCQWRNGLAEAAVKLLKSTLELSLTSQKTLNYAELLPCLQQYPISLTRDLSESEVSVKMKFTESCQMIFC